jgi:hypothetical protein
VINPERILSAAQGFIELGMFEDAWDELESLPFDESRVSGPVLDLRVQWCMGQEKWDMGAKIARGGIEKNPECLELYLSGSYCIRRCGGLEEAFEFLVKGHLSGYLGQPARGMYWFNLGCYHCQLGRNKEALDCVGQAVEVDKVFQRLAVEDKDLEPLWDSMAVRWP